MNQIQAWLGQHFKTLDDVGTAFGIGAFLFAGLGGLFKIERLTWLGSASLGAAALAWGVNAIQSRELRILQRGIPVWERIEETFARVWGIVFALGGLLLFGYGILAALNPRAPIPASVQQFFTTPPGSSALMLIGSAVGLLFALTLIFVSSARANNAVARFILSLPARLFGILLFIIFSALALIALLQIFAPDALAALGHTFLQRIGLE